MLQAKVIYADDSKKLESSLNAFLAGNPAIKIVSATQAVVGTKQRGARVVLIYELQADTGKGGERKSRSATASSNK